MSKSNPTALITGAASGLGRELAVVFAQRGYSICVADLHQERGEETVELVREQQQEAFFQPLDVGEFEDFESAKSAMLSRWQRIDVLINNAGVASAGAFEAVSLERWEWMLSINLMGVVRGCKALVPYFKERNGGSIINIASKAGLLSPPGMAEYCVAKAGVISLSETLYSELKPYGINLTVVCPSFFKTNLGESLRVTEEHIAAEFRQLLETSAITAYDIALQTYGAMEEEQLFLLPHAQARQAYETKKQAPEVHYRDMLKISERNKQKKQRC